MDNTTTFILVGYIFSSNNSSADALRSTEIAGGWQSTSLRHSLDFVQYVVRPLDVDRGPVSPVRDRAWGDRGLLDPQQVSPGRQYSLNRPTLHPELLTLYHYFESKFIYDATRLIIKFKRVNSYP